MRLNWPISSIVLGDVSACVCLNDQLHGDMSLKWIKLDVPVFNLKLAWRVKWNIADPGAPEELSDIDLLATVEQTFANTTAQDQNLGQSQIAVKCPQNMYRFDGFDGNQRFKD